jgi:hypothetical protein
MSGRRVWVEWTVGLGSYFFALRSRLNRGQFNVQLHYGQDGGNGSSPFATSTCSDTLARYCWSFHMAVHAQGKAVRRIETEQHSRISGVGGVATHTGQHLSRLGRVGTVPRGMVLVDESEGSDAVRRHSLMARNAQVPHRLSQPIRVVRGVGVVADCARTRSRRTVHIFSRPPLILLLDMAREAGIAFRLCRGVLQRPRIPFVTTETAPCGGRTVDMGVSSHSLMALIASRL